MSRPGMTITRSETRTSRSARTATGPWFAAGITGTVDAGDGVRKSVRSLTEYATRFGARSAHSDTVLYDAVKRYFEDGGSEVYVSRTADAVDATLTAALALFTKDLGPGQVSAPGRVTATAHVIIDAHAEANNRVSITDGPNTAVVATHTALTTPAGITAAQERRSSYFAPWVTVPGETPGSTINIPPSAVVAAAMSRNDARGVTPNQPSAGELGVSPTALNVTQSWTDADRTTLNANGVNVLRSMFDGVRIYGYRTLADPTTDPNYINLANARLYMAIEAEASLIAERFVFRQLDGQRLTITEFGGALIGMLIPYWQRGSLYGTSPNEAFRVDVGEDVNTDETIEAGELHARISLKMSEFAEEVIIDLVKTRITEII